MTKDRPAGPSRRMRIHVGIHAALICLYFLPGGLLWNRVEPLLFGLPFGVFITAVVLPVLIIANMGLYVRGNWAEDQRVTSAVRRPSVVGPIERIVASPGVAAGATRGGETPSDPGE